jgi:hypothetical protein
MFSHSDFRFHFRQNHAQEVAAMSKSVDELHNHEDITSFRDGVLFYIAMMLLICVVGVVFWSAF